MIKAIICDFDGTLADTFTANYHAYQKAFDEQGLTLTEETYRAAFGLRYDDFMRMMDIQDPQIAHDIRERKKELYPQYFHLLRPNKKLLDFVRAIRNSDIKTAIASTARKENLQNVVTYLGIEKDFDLIQSGNDVRQGKPDPEIYVRVMESLHVRPEETLIFEDTEIGIQAAQASGAKCIQVTNNWYSNLNGINRKGT